MTNAIGKVQDLYSNCTVAKSNFRDYLFTLDQALQDDGNVPKEKLREIVRMDALLGRKHIYPYSSTEIEQLQTLLPNTLSINIEILEQARCSVYVLHKSSNIPTIVRNYELISELSNLVSKIDLTPILHECVKDGIQLKEERIKDYSLIPMNTPKNQSSGFEVIWGNKFILNGRKQFKVWLDTPIAIALTYKGEPNALIGFSLSNPTTLCVPQIQGVTPRIYVKGDQVNNNQVRGHSRGLIVLNWEKLFIRVVEILARDFGINKIVIQCAKNNGNIHGSSTEKRYERRYDKSALDSGYIKAWKNHNFYKKLNFWSKYIPFWSYFRSSEKR